MAVRLQTQDLYSQYVSQEIGQASESLTVSVRGGDCALAVGALSKMSVPEFASLWTVSCRHRLLDKCLLNKQNKDNVALADILYLHNVLQNRHIVLHPAPPFPNLPCPFSKAGAYNICHKVPDGAVYSSSWKARVWQYNVSETTCSILLACHASLISLVMTSCHPDHAWSSHTPRACMSAARAQPAASKRCRQDASHMKCHSLVALSRSTTL